MIEASLLGGLLGGVSRVAPELFKFFGAKGERKHELQMLSASVEADKARAAVAMTAADQSIQAAQFTESVSALKEALQGQATKSGNTLLDGINMMVRPTVTYIVFAMWVLVKMVALYSAMQTMAITQAVPLWWNEADQAMLSAILNFWFMGRVFEKALK